MEKIRKSTKIKKIEILKFSLFFVVFGVVMGVISKFLDTTAINELPPILEILDIGNFLSRMAIWIFIAQSIALFTKSPYRAGLYVLLFFSAMVISYYLYSYYVAGFFPYHYAMIWATLTLISPFLAFVVWLAKGQGKIAIIISALIFSAMFNLTFSYGIFYFDVNNVLELILFIITVLFLKREKKEMIYVIVLGIIMAVILNQILPFHFG
ncbi:MAG: hypothetical protein GX914_03675 [Erysipelotrichia bacterium]|nr:hypothetical protein [Erysipelotrichia bacterium]